ncbi:MAG TPA: DNA mismatch repair endonuclease MutL [Bacteroidales bacterium]|nr:DNA mismatch repair endonuclease MutL [Bacteroidales bacterium]
MAEIIKLLSDSVANQIAAGEVIQRPASVVKELTENAIDAGAKEIQIIIKDAGKTLIQIIDDGIGMSPVDARMAFERHATSKISEAKDLFAIRTMGFRGEALASIAAVATVELKTRRENDDVGTHVIISGSEVLSQDPVSCSKGSNFMVKNLFFNIPARRKFLKTDNVENRNILNEVYRIVLAHPELSFLVVCDNNTLLKLSPENLRQRIVSVFGKSLNQHLINLSVETSLINITGFIAKPERSRKSTSEQFFFVNNRYMLHPYFRKSVTMAYDKLIAEGEHPSFFIYFETSPASIDINIHPTKTEIKFEDEQAIFQILNATVKEALGKFNIIPGLDFEENITRDAHLTSKTSVKPPAIAINPDYNPFESTAYNRVSNSPPKNWQSLYSENTQKTPDDFYLPQEKTFLESNQLIPEQNQISSQTKNVFFQLKNKYILTSGKSGMIVIDQKRAHERILFEKFLGLLETRKGVVQKSLFPVIYEPGPDERAVLIEVITELNNIGFEIALIGKDKFEIRGVPGDLTDIDPLKTIEQMVYVLGEVSGSAEMVLNEKIALSLAKTAAFKIGKVLREEEMQELFYKLMSCVNHNYTVDGKKILEIINIDEIEKKLN